MLPEFEFLVPLFTSVLRVLPFLVAVPELELELFWRVDFHSSLFLVALPLFVPEFLVVLLTLFSLLVLPRFTVASFVLPELTLFLLELETELLPLLLKSPKSFLLFTLLLAFLLAND